MACVFLAGCIQSDTVIEVKKDGSGLIVETVKLSNMLLDSLKNMSKNMAEGEADAKDKPKAEPEDPMQSMMKDAAVRVKQYGTDVKLVSAVPVKGETMSGYKATYSFTDINTLRINQNPEGKTGKPADGQPAKKEEIITFRLVKGPVSVLTVTMPKEKTEKKPVEAVKKEKTEADAAAEEMVRMMFKDMSVKVILVMEGTIVKTNATYREGSKLTIIDMDFGKILENKDAFEKLNAAQPKTIEETKELVKGIKGLKIEMNNPVLVEFM
jgi:hypothetical protein